MLILEAVPFYEDAIFWVQFALAVLTGLLFVATYLVAARTKSLAEDTVGATKSADRHHQESLMPVVQWLGTAVMHETKTPRGETVFNLTYRGSVKNVGTGPALNVRAEFRIHGSLVFNMQNRMAMSLGAIAPGDSFDHTFPVTLQPGNTAGAPINESLAYEVTLTYENLFRKTCQTVHSNTGGNGQTTTEYTPPDTSPRLLSQ